MLGWFTEWQLDCLRWRGNMLTGNFAHWCAEWDGLPVDETCSWWIRDPQDGTEFHAGEWPCGCYVKLESGTYLCDTVTPRKLTQEEIERLWPKK